MVIHAVLAIVNVPFVTAYFTKSTPRQTVDRGKRDTRVRISAGRQATPKEPLRAVRTEAGGEETATAIRRRDLRQKSSAADRRRSAAKLPRPVYVRLLETAIT